MALSMPPPHTTWDRTLPNPASLLPSGVDSRRSSSLLQHRISTDHFLAPVCDASGRRNTVHCLPRPDNKKDHEEYVRQCQEPAMSGEAAREASSEGTSPSESASEYCLCVPDPKIPRPRNAFILYRQNQHAEVVKTHPGMPNPEISKIIGEQWQRLSPQEKDKWKAFAEQEKARHTQQYPDYRYRPRRSGKYSTDGSAQPVSQSTSCSKCGGKTMNPPHTPHYPPYDHAPPVGAPRPKRPFPDQHVQPRPSIVQVAPASYGAPLRYGYPPRHDSVHYGPPPPHHGPPPHLVEGPDAKRRRMNSPYAPRPSYDPYYDRPPHPDQGARHPMGPPGPPRASYAGPTSAPPCPVVPIQHRRDPSLTLPPLKTGTGQRGSIASTQKSGVEAMIMSYPVLTKLKTLHSITPLLAAPGPASPAREVRGVIIAIEGLDPKRVLDMTQSLAEQLEREGKFLVRTFNGPNPYDALHSSRRASIKEGGEPMTTEKYLRLISEWHQVSKDMIEFITTKPGKVEEVKDQDMPDASAKTATTQNSPFDRPPTSKSPISAVSPGTVAQAARMKLETHQIASRPDVSPRLTRSRIPAAALKDNITSVPPPPPSSDRPQTPPPPSPASDKTATPPSTASLIPVALVPHYQLTTVDTCSIALPIFDNYDPLTHWRWHATLWRGCVGPDISVVIKSANEQHEDEVVEKRVEAAAMQGRAGSVAPPATGRLLGLSGSTEQAPPSGAPPTPAAPAQAQPAAQAASTPAPTPFGVEVRLQDHRAVIIRAANSSARGSDASEKDVEKDNENWDKAKRRVGFEVEEWMRR